MGAGTSCNRCSLEGMIVEAERAGGEVILVIPSAQKRGEKGPFLGGFDIYRCKPGGDRRKLAWFWSLGKLCECETSIDDRFDPHVADVDGWEQDLVDDGDR